MPITPVRNRIISITTEDIGQRGINSGVNLLIQCGFNLRFHRGGYRV